LPKGRDRAFIYPLRETVFTAHRLAFLEFLLLISSGIISLRIDQKTAKIWLPPFFVLLAVGPQFLGF